MNQPVRILTSELLREIQTVRRQAGVVVSYSFVVKSLCCSYFKDRTFCVRILKCVVKMSLLVLPVMCWFVLQVTRVMLVMLKMTLQHLLLLLAAAAVDCPYCRRHYLTSGLYCGQSWTKCTSSFRPGLCVSGFHAGGSLFVC